MLFHGSTCEYQKVSNSLLYWGDHHEDWCSGQDVSIAGIGCMLHASLNSLSNICRLMCRGSVLKLICISGNWGWMMNCVNMMLG